MQMYFPQSPIVPLHLGTYPRQMLMLERHFHGLQEFFNSKYQYFFILNHAIMLLGTFCYAPCVAKGVVQPLNKNLRIDDPVPGCSMPHPPHELSIIFINRVTSIG